MASFSFGAGNAGKLLRIPLYLAGRAATIAIPRSRDLWVFGSAVGLADGGLALERHAAANGERTVWLTGTAAERGDAARRGIRSVAKQSLRGFWLTARDSIVSAVRPYTSRKTAERELRRLRNRFGVNVRKFERRGTTERNKLERQVKRTRTQAERELRQRRQSVERVLRQSQRDFERGADKIQDGARDVVHGVEELAGQR